MSDELTKKLKQNITETDYLQKALSLSQAEGDKLQAQIEAEDKPKLRHGDYGLDSNGQPCIEIKIWGKKLKDVGDDGMHFNSPGPDETGGLEAFRVVKPIGNIFDDLKALTSLTEELREFEAGYPSALKVAIATCHNKGADVTLTRDGGFFDVTELTEIRDNLTKLLRTVKSDWLDLYKKTLTDDET